MIRICFEKVIQHHLGIPSTAPSTTSIVSLFVMISVTCIYRSTIFAYQNVSQRIEGRSQCTRIEQRLPSGGTYHAEAPENASSTENKVTNEDKLLLYQMHHGILHTKGEDTGTCFSNKGSLSKACTLLCRSISLGKSRCNAQEESVFRQLRHDDCEGVKRCRCGFRHTAIGMRNLGNFGNYTLQYTFDWQDIITLQRGSYYTSL